MSGADCCFNKLHNILLNSLLLSLDDEATWCATSTFACSLSGLFKVDFNDG